MSRKLILKEKLRKIEWFSRYDGLNIGGGENGAVVKNKQKCVVGAIHTKTPEKFLQLYFHSKACRF
jgi:hypothetical protein